MARITKAASERKGDIVAAARRLFLSKGYDNTTMRQVMETLNIAKGTIYHYFRSKEELLDAVIEEIVAEDLVRLKALRDSRTGGSALDRLKHCITAAKASAREHDALLEALHQPANAGMHIRLLARMVTEQAPIYAELVEAGCAEGIFATQYPLECAEFIYGAIQFLTDVGIYPWPAEHLRRRVAALPALVEAQLKAPPGSFAFLAEMLN